MLGIYKIIAGSFSSLLTSLLGAFAWVRLGSASQKNEHREAAIEEMQDNAEIDSSHVDPDDAYDGLSGWGKKRADNDS